MSLPYHRCARCNRYVDEPLTAATTPRYLCWDCWGEAPRNPVKKESAR